MTQLQLSRRPAAATALAVSALLTACGGGEAPPDPQSAASSFDASAQELMTAARRGAPDPRAILMREPPQATSRLVSLEEVRNGSRPHRHRYFIRDLGSLGGTESFAYALNDRTQVVGTSRTAGDANTHKFLYSDGLITDLFPLDSESIQTGSPTEINDAGVVASGVISGGLYMPALLDTGSGSIAVLPCLGGSTGFGFSGAATAVNNRGVAVGYCQVDATTRHAFVHGNGVTTDIDGFGGYSVATDINDDGAATGFVSREVAGIAGAFVYRNGTMTEIFPVGTESYGRGINSRGHVVGEYLAPDGSGFRPYLYRDGTATDLGSNDSRQTVPLAINDADQVVGVKDLSFASTCSYGPCTVTKQFAFVWTDGQMALLDALIPRHADWELNWAFDINNNGQIVGYGTRDGKFRAFLLTPATSPKQCQGGAWRDLGFSSNGRCVAFVVSGH